MARKFRDWRVEQFAGGRFVKPFSGFGRTLERRLRALDDATTLDDIRSVREHHLKVLVGDCEGQYSIRINDQYRICFEWPDDSIGAIEVEVTDFH